MKTVEQILERIEDEIRVETITQKMAVQTNNFDLANRAATRQLAFEQLRDWIQSEQEASDAEKC